MISKEKLKEYAEKLMFNMKEEEYDVLLGEFDIILKQMELIDNIQDISSVKPMTFPFVTYDISLREDFVKNSLDVDDVLRNAKYTSDNQVKVPKVVE